MADPEVRIDPEDGEVLSFQAVVAKYKGQYGRAAIDDYWKKSMHQVDTRPPPSLTALSVSFCPDPKSLGAKFTASYEPVPTKMFASANAGDENLRVGGATLNGQFAKDLKQFAGQDPDLYQALHRRLFAQATPGELCGAGQEILDLNPALIGSFVRRGAGSSTTGVVFIDVFREEARVHRHTKNCAMVYVVGPRRRDCKSDSAFLLQVEQTAANMSRACSDYNALAGSKGLPPLEVVRVPLISGGAFAGSCPKHDVAAALIRGAADGCAAAEREGLAPEFNLAFDGDVFKHAWVQLGGAA